MRAILLLTAFLFVAQIAYSTNYYVNASTGSDIPANGTLANPWKTITYALSQINGTGHTINVAAGTYNTALGETFPIMMEDGVSLVGAGMDLSIISGTTAASVIKCVGILDATTKIEALGITGGGSSTGGNGIYISAGSALEVNNNKIYNNSYGSNNYGGGLHIINSSPKLNNNIISGNYAYAGGGGIYISNGSPLITNNVISSNSLGHGGYYGNGIYITNGSPIVKNNIVLSNTNGYYAVYISGSTCSPEISNNIIAKNSSDGIYCTSSSTPSIINNTISDNGGEGIHINSALPVLIINNIISYNLGYGIQEYNTSSDPGQVSYNLFYQNSLGIYQDEGNTDYYSISALNSGVTECKSNISGNPIFTDRANNNFHEKVGSPSVDAGHTSYAYTNEPAPNGSRINIGAYGNTTEATITGTGSTTSSTDYYVDAISGSNTTGDGTSGKPWKTITFTLDQITNSSCTVHVAAGTYNTALGETFPIMMEDGVSLVGAGKDLSIISGTTAASVIKCVGILDATTKIEALGITEGGSSSGGNGIYISAGSVLEINNNKIYNNSYGSNNYGGGLHIINSSPKIINNTISGNYAYYGGGGIYISNCSPLISNNTINSNSASSSWPGSGIYINYGSPIVKNNIILNNTSAYNTVYITGSSCSPEISNNIIAKNSSDGITCIFSSTPSIINNTISDNGGQGIEIHSASPTSITNNIISFNLGYGIHEFDNSSDPGQVTYNLFYQNSLGIYQDEANINYSAISTLNSGVTECKNNISGNPIFTDRANSNFHEKVGSPAVDAGNPSHAYTNEPAPNGSRINIGAYGNTTEATITGTGNTTSSTDYYVDAITGNNTTGDGTSGKPWKTITYALDQITNTSCLVHIGSGTYNTALGEIFPIMMEDGVSLVGAGKDLSIISGTTAASVIKCIGIFDATAKIEGLGITGGGSTSGGNGIYISAGSSLEINNNKIYNNSYVSWPNTGGGINITNSSPKISNNIISGNSAAYGGGISISMGSPQITNNTINDNYCSHYGSGIYIKNGSPTVKGNIIVNNSEDAICITGSTSSPEISNNIIAKNSSDGIYCASSCTPIINNNTISDNGGDGIDIYSASPVSIVNNIISYNTGYGIEESDTYSDPGQVLYNLFYQNSLGLYRNEGTTNYYSAIDLNTNVTECKNNLEGNPLFADKANNDYQIQTGSPAIDAGNPASPLDIDNTRADIGALPLLDLSNLTAEISISTTSTTVCQNTEVTFTATPTNEGTEPIYQWKINGGNVGTNSTSYSTTTLANNDVVTCVLTSNLANVLGSPATSNAITMTINPLPVAPGSITGAAGVCLGTNNVIYSVPSITNATSYIWTKPDGTTGSSTTNSITLNFGAGSVTGNVTVKGNNTCGNGAVSTKAVSVDLPITTNGTITGSSDICQGSGGSYSVAAITNATSNIWEYSGTGATINGSGNNVTISFSNNATSGNLTVKGTNSCNDGPISANYAVSFIPLPSEAGTISGIPTVCPGQNSVTYSVSTINNATSYSWNYSGTGATITGTGSSVTIGFSKTATSGNLTVKGTNSCGDGTISANYAITINPFPDGAGIITGSASVCQGASNIIYTVPEIANATNYIWTLPSGATGNSTTNSISLNFSTIAVADTIKVNGNNICGNGLASSYAYKVILPTGAAGKITGTAAVCKGQNNVSYSVPAIANATSYIWNYSGTGTTISSTGSNVTISFSNLATSGNLTVKGSNSCGDGAISANYAIIVNSVPDAAGTITGSTEVCRETNDVIYTVPTITNATNYVWTLPSGIVGSSSTNSITANFGADAISGNITIKGSNSCGYGTVSTINVNVKLLTGPAGSITGTKKVCQGQADVSYLVAAIANAASYIWNYSGNGATINVSDNNASITFSDNATSGILTVKGTNSCGEGTFSADYAITLNYFPTATGSISGKETVCQGEKSREYNLSEITNAQNYIWTLPIGITGVSNSNSIIVDFGADAVSGNIKVKGTNECGHSDELSLALTVKNASLPEIKSKWDEIVFCPNNDNSFKQFQWYKNDILISGATNQFYDTQKETGSYYVITIDASGCSSQSNIIDLTSVLKSLIYPNPAKDYIEVKIQDEKTGVLSINLLNTAGKIVKHYKTQKTSTIFHENISTSGLPPGIYTIEFKIDGKYLMNYKLIISE